MTWAETAALLLFASAMSFTPGPNTTLAATLGANLGLRPALRFVFAVPVGWVLLLLACTAGVGGALQALPQLRGALKLAGLAYLLWLAFKLARSAHLPAAQGQPLRVGFWQGVALQFVNVKAWLAALAVSAGWITVAPPLLPRLAVVLPLMAGFAIASNLLYAVAGASLRGWLARGARLAWFNRGMAAVLVATAAWMAAS